MDDHLLYAPNSDRATASTAPGEGIPVWLYRRTLYLLEDRVTPRLARTQARIQRDLIEQTGIRVPSALLRAIAETLTNMNPYIRNRIYNFTEEDMRPGDGDFQIQPVAPIRRPAAVNPLMSAAARWTAQRRDESTGLNNPTDLGAQTPRPPQRSPGTEEAAATLVAFAQQASERQGSGRPQQSEAGVLRTPPSGQRPRSQGSQGSNSPSVIEVRTRLPDGANESTHPDGTYIDANEARRLRFPLRNSEVYLRGLGERSRPTTDEDRVRQRSLFNALRHSDVNAAEYIGDLEGDHVRPTSSYIQGTEATEGSQLRLDQDGYAYHYPLHPMTFRPSSPSQAQSRTGAAGQNQNGEENNGRRSGRTAPVATSRATTKTKATTTTKARTTAKSTTTTARARATRNPQPIATLQRETRATKRKRDDAAAEDLTGSRRSAAETRKSTTPDHENDGLPPAKKQAQEKGAGDSGSEPKTPETRTRITLRVAAPPPTPTRLQRITLTINGEAPARRPATRATSEAAQLERQQTEDSNSQAAAKSATPNIKRKRGQDEQEDVGADNAENGRRQLRPRATTEPRSPAQAPKRAKKDDKNSGNEKKDKATEKPKAKAKAPTKFAKTTTRRKQNGQDDDADKAAAKSDPKKKTLAPTQPATTKTNKRTRNDLEDEDDANRNEKAKKRKTPAPTKPATSETDKHARKEQEDAEEAQRQEAKAKRKEAAEKRKEKAKTREEKEKKRKDEDAEKKKRKK